MRRARVRPALPRRAFILAAGQATRLRPLTDRLPKPLLPFWGMPLLARTLGILRGWGVREVLINVHHAAGELVEWVRTHPVNGVHVSLSFEPGLLGTGGALARGRWFFPDDEAFWIVNGDVAFAVDPRPLAAAMERPRTVAAAWLVPDRGPRTVEAVRGRVTSFHSAHPGGPGTFTFAGVQVVSPRVLDHLPSGGLERFGSLIELYETARAAGGHVAGVTIPRSFWADLGTPAQMVAAHRAWWERTRGREAPALPHALRAEGFVAAAPDLVVQRGARVRNSVLLSGVCLARSARVDGAVVGPGVTVRGSASHLVLRAEDGLRPAEQAAVRRAGVRVAEAGAVFFEPRGSDRVFVRVRDARRSVLVIRYGRERPENERYAGHTRFLRARGLPVPRVLAEDADARCLVVEDAGDLSLEARVTHGLAPTALRRLYREVVGWVARWHAPALARQADRALRLEPRFDAALYAREHELFLDHFAGPHGGAGAAERRALRRDLERISGRLADAPAVLLHRDLQSSNILLVRRGPVFIDFQGMRLGPAMYDVASLLCDPYVELPSDLQLDLLADYRAAAGLRARTDLFWAAALQRLCQALGAYGRLGALPGAGRFLRHVPAGLRMVRRALAHDRERHPALERFFERRRG